MGAKRDPWLGQILLGLFLSCVSCTSLLIPGGDIE
jgi:hypothetical protein